MKPLEYLKFCEDDIYLRSIDGNFYSPEEAKEIIKTLESFVERLSEVRHSEEKTNLILNEIDQFPDSEMRSLKHWLVKSFADDDSFVYAFNPLAQYSNRQTIIVCYQVKSISKPELFQLLNAEEKEENPPKRFIIKSDDEMKKIYTICQEAFDCDYSTFRVAIESANFQQLKIKTKYIVQDLTYRLSGIMSDEWYTNVCREMNWTKSKCSGKNEKLEFEYSRKMNAILPRPSK